MLKPETGAEGSHHRSADTSLKGGTLFFAILVIAITYFTATHIGFTLGFAGQRVTVVWPSTGIALAAVLLLGKRILPGIALGAFLASYANHEPLIPTLGVTAANTLEALAASLMIHCFTTFNSSLGRLSDVISLLLFAVLCSTMFGANIGVISLCLGGLQSWSNYEPMWLLWWLGDATGALIVTPAILAWAKAPRSLMRSGTHTELMIMLAGLASTCFIIFTNLADTGNGIRTHLFIYAIFSFVIWGGLRFGQLGTTLVTLVSSGIAIWFDAQGMKPFANVSTDQGLILLLIFMSVVSATGLFLGAAITESTMATVALKIADRRKNEFLSMLAHELRNPLAPISNAVHMLEHLNLPPAKAKELHSIIRRQLGQVNRLVDDLLDVARITHGKIELRCQPLLLIDVMENVLEAVKPLMQSSKHRLSFRLPPKDAWLNADALRLEQIFVNLLNNSAKYTPQGGIISLDSVVESGRITIRIKDNGVGIPPSLLPKIFDLYMQVDYSMGHSQGGLGIGLTLVRRLVEMHGGKVTAHSLGSFKGSEFIVQLPLIKPPESLADITKKTTGAL